MYTCILLKCSFLIQFLISKLHESYIIFSSIFHTRMFYHVFCKKKLTHNSKIFVLLKQYFYMFSLCNVLNKVDFLHYGHQQINVIFSHFVLLIIHYKSLPRCRKFYYTRFKNCFVLTKLSC